MGSHHETAARDGGKVAWWQIILDVCQLLEPEVVACWLLPLPVASDPVRISVVGTSGQNVISKAHLPFQK